MCNAMYIHCTTQEEGTMVAPILFIVGTAAGCMITVLVAGPRDNRDDNFSCANCKYINNGFDFDEPCVGCRRAYVDKWEDSKDES